jgi:hypothetical protein
VARAEAQRRAGSRGPAEHLAGLGALRPVLTADRAAAEIYVLSGLEIFDQLTVTCGWSPQDPRDWLAHTLVVSFLDPDRRSDG